MENRRVRMWFHPSVDRGSRPEQDGGIDTSAAYSDRSQYPPDVRIVARDGREIVLIGTAHISRESADLVRAVVAREQPDCVCIELDQRRYEALSEQRQFQSLDLIEVVRRRQLATMVLNLFLASYQKQLGGQLGVVPGTELLEAAAVAKEYGIPISLCDRDIRVTLRRAWHAMPWWRRFVLLSALLGAVFEPPELTEDDLRELRQQDVGTRLIQELGETFPSLKRVLIDERDTYLAQKICDAPGQRIVAVVGAGHVAGIERTLQAHQPVSLEPLEVMPTPSPVWKWLGWGIPVLIVASMAFIGWRQGIAAAGASARFWILASGTGSLIGALLALAHPLTSLAAFIATPFTGLSPIIGVGHVAALVQTWLRPPLVSEIQNVSRDIRIAKMWWQNRLLRILLVFIFTSIGGSIGVFIGGAEIISRVFGH